MKRWSHSSDTACKQGEQFTMKVYELIQHLGEFPALADVGAYIHFQDRNSGTEQEINGIFMNGPYVQIEIEIADSTSLLRLLTYEKVQEPSH